MITPNFGINEQLHSQVDNIYHNLICPSANQPALPINLNLINYIQIVLWKLLTFNLLLHNAISYCDKYFKNDTVGFILF